MAKTRRIRTDDGPALQYAALPWRRSISGAVEVLLVSSRETKRWVIPKGWPIKKLDPAASAAREAFEEAGVVGVIDGDPVGVFHYSKRLSDGVELFCRVLVFPMVVALRLDEWPEKGQRALQWFSLVGAADAVDEPELKALILDFAPE
jgi:8-oxo-dGTP pyrophosphatase MutT (NUDIX family)